MFRKDEARKKKGDKLGRSADLGRWAPWCGGVSDRDVGESKRLCGGKVAKQGWPLAFPRCSAGLRKEGRRKKENRRTTTAAVRDGRCPMDRTAEGDGTSAVRGGGVSEYVVYYQTV